MFIKTFVTSVPEASSFSDESYNERKSNRLIVTLNGPRPSSTASGAFRAEKTRRACSLLNLSVVSCDVAVSDVFVSVKHCPKSDVLIIETHHLADQEDISRGIECLGDYLDEDPDQAELDAEVHILAEQNFKQWHIEAISVHGSDGFNAWDYSKGSDDIIVAIIDTGIDYTHPDLQTNIWMNRGEIPDNGIDDDGNGFVDDVFGYDFANDDSDPYDDNGHGTHCAGIVGGVANVKERVSGVSPNVRIMAIKALDANGNGRLSDVIAAVEYSLEMGAHITSNSFGTPDIKYSVAFSRLLNVLERTDQLYVAAAGNKHRNADMEPEFPASLHSPIILSVAATTRDDQLADFSNFGATSIDLGAPGVDILSTQRHFGYGYAKGTSAATPLVAATAALVLSTISKEKNSTHARGMKVKEIILLSVDLVPDLEGKTLSGGRLNAGRAVALAGDYPCCEDESSADLEALSRSRRLIRLVLRVAFIAFIAHIIS